MIFYYYMAKLLSFLKNLVELLSFIKIPLHYFQTNFEIHLKYFLNRGYNGTLRRKI